MTHINVGTMRHEQVEDKVMVATGVIGLVGFMVLTTPQSQKVKWRAPNGVRRRRTRAGLQ
jgi:hypothetical protein